ncbi:beta-lactamase domain-containing protein 2-like isoform X2 [Lineus longissimus]|uniref:beta-lactamase domain-containing protein 2-like isoform X2 n=1 Tax=Lineus longissimus TaxID=88925 RepID=UPI002B4E1493
MALFKLAVLVLLVALVVVLRRRRSLEFHVDGFVAAGFEEVDKTFRELIKNGMYGGAFTAYYRGKPVVDLWGGYADVDSKQRWEKDTISMAFSTTKGLAALCIGVLVTRGHVKYDDPVASFWPEFAANGKESITLRTLMNHEAGLIGLDEPLSLEDLLTDSPKVSQYLAKQKPFWEPGSGHGYHAISIGPYVDQVVRRVDPKKRNVTQFFEDEIAKPLGVDFSLHLKPSERYRDSRLVEQPGFYGLLDTIWCAFETWDFQMVQCFYEMVSNPASLIAKAIGMIDMPESYNHIDKKIVEISSVTGHGTARALAKIYGMITMDGGMVNGKPLISDSVLLEFMQVPDEITKDKVVLLPISYSGGMSHLPTPAGDWMFGTPGFGGQMGHGDPKKQIGLGFLTNHLRTYIVVSDPRTQSLFKAVYSSVKKMEETKK